MGKTRKRILRKIVLKKYNYHIALALLSVYNEYNKTKGGNHMFVSVKSLTTMLDQDLQWYREGIVNKEMFSEQEFNSWLEKITSSINAKYSRLQQISCNKSLIEKYKKEIEALK